MPGIRLSGVKAGLVAALSAIAFFAAPAGAGSAEIDGVWSGIASQNSGQSGYGVVMTFRDGAGTSAYPALNCGGTLTRAGSADGYVFYTETITYGGVGSGGGCIDGTMTVTRDGGALVWGWVGAYQGEVYVAWSLLSRK